MTEHNETANCVVCGKDTYKWESHETEAGFILLGLIGLVATVQDGSIKDEVSGTHLGHFYFCSWAHVEKYAHMVGQLESFPNATEE